MQIEDFTLAGPLPLALTLHPRLTIVRGCSSELRQTLCQGLPGAFYGFDVVSKVHWSGRSGEAHVVGALDSIVPRVTVIHHDQVDRPERLADLVAVAQTVGAGRAPGLLVLDEPFHDLNAGETWRALDILGRLSARSQMLLLTEDPCVEAWADHHEGAGTLCTVDLQPQDSL